MIVQTTGARSPVRPAPPPELLSVAAEHALFRRWRERGDRAALARLITAHEPMIRAVVGPYRAAGLPVADLLQQGRLALIEAARLYYPELGCRFRSFAERWLRSEITDYLNRDHGDERRAAPDVLSGDGGWPSEPPPLDVLPSTEPTPEADAIESEQARARARWLKRAWRRLDARQRTVLGMRYMAGDHRATLKQVGAHLGISAARVRQIEMAAIAKLQRWSCEAGLWAPDAH